MKDVSPGPEAAARPAAVAGRGADSRILRRLLMGLLAVTLAFGLLIPLLILLVAEPLSRLQAWRHYRQSVAVYNGSDWMKRPEIFFRSYFATPDNPIEFRLCTNVTRTIPQLDGHWRRRTNSGGLFLNQGWHLVDSNGLPVRYLAHRFVPDRPDWPALGGHWEGLVSRDPAAVQPWLIDCLDDRVLPAGVLPASAVSQDVAESDRWRLVMNYREERGEIDSGPRWVLRPTPVYEGLPAAHRTWTHHLNEHGFRGWSDTGGAAEADEFRVMFLGDSMLFGWGLEEHETLTRVLEAGCRSRGLPAQMINCGVPGYNTRQEYRCLKEQFERVQPDAVVLCYCVNDAEPPLSLPFSNPDRYFRYVSWNSWFFERSKRPVRHLMLGTYRAVNNGLSRIGIDAEFVRDFPVQDYWPRSSGHIGRNEVMRGWRKGVKPRESRRALRDIKRFCDAKDVPLRLAVLPAFNGPVADYPLVRIHSDVIGWAKELDIPANDLLPAFAGERDWQSLRVWRKDGHPSAKAVRVFASRLRRPLMKLIER